MNYFSKLFAMLVVAMAAMHSEAFSGIQDGVEGSDLEISNFLCGNNSTLPIVQLACDTAGSFIGAQLDEVLGGGGDEGVRKLRRGDSN